jgi:two-component system chemotaxis sensor kinase CheA
VVSYETGVIHYINGSKVTRIRNEVLPLINLDEITGDKESDIHSSKYVVNLAVGIERVGLVVNELLGQHEIVIKSLGNFLTNIEGIAGSTIIGDGRVIMILDTQGIVKKYKEKYKN